LDVVADVPASIFRVEVYRLVSSHFDREDGGSMYLRNDSNITHNHIV
jgi:hypothetical protein